MYLNYQELLRNEDNQEIIDNLLRKGWTEQIPPPYDPATEQPPQWINGGWVILPIPAPQPYKVSKDTIITRLISLNAIAQAMAAISTLTAEEQFIWTNSAWFWSNNQAITNMCIQLGLDPTVILAQDPYFS